MGRRRVILKKSPDLVIDGGIALQMCLALFVPLRLVVDGLKINLGVWVYDALSFSQIVNGTNFCERLV